MNQAESLVRTSPPPPQLIRAGRLRFGHPHPRYRAVVATALRCREGNRLHKQTNPPVGTRGPLGRLRSVWTGVTPRAAIGDRGRWAKLN